MIGEINNIPLLLFAKAPVAGRVKTRLTTHCSPVQAAEIAEILIETSLLAATQHWPGKVYLSIWQDQKNNFINAMLEKHSVDFLPQVAGDLGAKMHASFEQVGYPAAIMGCDAPLITSTTFEYAYQLLSQGKNVIGPSEDGGYYLIGLNQAYPELFSNISWGTEVVLNETIEVADNNTIELNQLAHSFDIDRWSDITQAVELIPQLKRYLVSQGLLEPDSDD